MPKTITLTIAGLNLVISSENNTSLQDFDACYRPFYDKATDAGEIIRVNVHAGLPDSLNLGEMGKMFETGRSWSMFKEDKDYFLAMDPPGFETLPIVIARFSCPVEKVDVFFNDMTEERRFGKREIPNFFSYPIDRLLITYILADRKGSMFHAAGIEIGGRGYVFAGRSGVGKSTLSLLCASRIGLDVLSDERVIIRRIGDEMMVCGTPWPGETGIISNKALPLGAVFFLRQGDENKISGLKPAEAVDRLLPVATIPWYDPEIMTEALSFCENMLSTVPSYELCFTPGDEVVDMLEEFAHTY